MVRVYWSKEFGHRKNDTLIIESSRLRIAQGTELQQCESLRLTAEKDDAVPGTRMPLLLRLEKGMSEVLRGASERDDGQMLPTAEELHFDLEGPCSTTVRVHRSLR